MKSRPTSKLNQWERSHSIAVDCENSSTLLKPPFFWWKGKARVILLSGSSEGQSSRAGGAARFIRAWALSPEKELHLRTASLLFLYPVGKVAALCNAWNHCTKLNIEQRGEVLVNLGCYVSDLGFAGVFLRQLIFRNSYWNCMSHTFNLTSSWFPLFKFWLSQSLFMQSWTELRSF